MDSINKQWSTEKRTFCLKLFYELKSYSAMLSDSILAGLQRGKNTSKSVIYGWIKIFEQEGGLENHKSNSGRKRIPKGEVFDD